MNDQPEADVRTRASRSLYFARLRGVFAIAGMLALIVGIACVVGFKHYGGLPGGDIVIDRLGDQFLNGAIIAMSLSLVSILCLEVCNRVR